jgi:hypothetical protein
MPHEITRFRFPALGLLVVRVNQSSLANEAVTQPQSIPRKLSLAAGHTDVPVFYFVVKIGRKSRIDSEEKARRGSGTVT